MTIDRATRTELLGNMRDARAAVCEWGNFWDAEIDDEGDISVWSLGSDPGMSAWRWLSDEQVERFLEWAAKQENPELDAASR